MTFGLFLDLGGKDLYQRRAAGGELAADPDAKDGATWRLRERDPSSSAGPNVSLGRDVPTRARLGFLDAWPARVPPARPTPPGEVVK